MIFFKNKETDEQKAEDSFARAALPHMKSLYGAALQMTRDPAAAEDLVQETFLKAHRFWHRYQEGTNCKAWLFRVQTNLFINRNRRKNPSAALMDELDSAEQAPELYQGSGFYDRPDIQAERERFPERVEQALQSLPEAFRLPVVLADLQDFSYREIAEIMGCPVGTVMSRLYRGRQQLQEALFDHAVEVGVIEERSAADPDGAVSLEAYRAQKRRASNS